MRHRYVATLEFADGSTLDLTFRSRATKTGTVHTHAAAAAEKAGYSGFEISTLAGGA